MKQPLLTRFIILFSALLTFNLGYSTAVSWDGGGDNMSWSDSLNWSNDTVPRNIDVVTLGQNVNVIIGDGVAAVAMQLDINNGSLTVNATGFLTVIGGTHGVTVNTMFTNYGTTHVSNTTNQTFRIINGGDVFNHGLLELSGAGSESLDVHANLTNAAGTGRFTNEPTGIIYIEGGASHGIIVRSDGGDYYPYFLNRGRIELGKHVPIGADGIVLLNSLRADFTNESTGVIIVHNAASDGIFVQGYFKNSGSVEVRNTGNDGITIAVPVQFDARYDNLTGGVTNIGSCGSIGAFALRLEASNFTRFDNYGGSTLIVGNCGDMGFGGVYVASTANGFTNYDGGVVQLFQRFADVNGQARNNVGGEIVYYYVGDVTVFAGDTSNITVNSGTIYNINGDKFVAAGGSQPTTDPTPLEVEGCAFCEQVFTTMSREDLLALACEEKDGTYKVLEEEFTGEQDLGGDAPRIKQYNGFTIEVCDGCSFFRTDGIAVLVSEGEVSPFLKIQFDKPVSAFGFDIQTIFDDMIGDVPDIGIVIMIQTLSGAQTFMEVVTDDQFFGVASSTCDPITKIEFIVSGTGKDTSLEVADIDNFISIICNCLLEPCDLTCNDNVLVSLGPNCTREIAPADVLENEEACNKGGLLVDVIDHYGQSMGPYVGADHMGRKLVYRLKDPYSGNSCWGYVTIEDKYPPQVECDSMVISCWEVIPTEEDLTNMASDNCAGYPVQVNIISEKWEEFDCVEGICSEVCPPGQTCINGMCVNNYAGQITRVIQSVDVWGNAKTCTQVIYIDRPDIDSVYIQDEYIEIECSWIATGTRKYSLGLEAGGDQARNLWQALWECRDTKSGSSTSRNTTFANETYADMVEEVEINGKTYLVPLPACQSSSSSGGNFAGREIQEYCGNLNGNANVGFGTGFWPRPPRLIDEGEEDWVWPVDLPSTLTKNFGKCEVYAHFKDHIIPTCGHTYKIRREWKIVDWCGQGPNGKDTTIVQYIKVVDQEGPAPPDPKGAVDDVVPYYCIATPVQICLQIPTVVMVATDELNVDQGFGPDCLPGTLVYFGGYYNAKSHDCKTAVDLTPLEMGECWEGDWKAHYIVKIPDPTHPGRDIFQEGSIEPGKSKDIYLPSGWHWIEWTYTDYCNNHTVIWEQVHVEDVTPPTPVCDEITQVTLDPEECWARVYAEDLDDGSNDNCCGTLHFAVAKMSEVDHYREKWNTFFDDCGNLPWDREVRDDADQMIEDWITCFVFDEYVDLSGCEEEMVIVRVFEACEIKPYDPHVFHGTKHEWFCYNTWNLYAKYYSWTYFDRLDYKDPYPEFYCEYDYDLGYQFGLEWGYAKGMYAYSKLNREILTNPTNDRGLGLSEGSTEYQLLQTLYENCWGEECLPIVEYPIDVVMVTLADNKNFFGFRSDLRPLYSECMVQILVDDKVPPICEAPVDVSIFCDGVPYGDFKKRYCNKNEVYDYHDPHDIYHVCKGGEYVDYSSSISANAGRTPYSTGCTLYVKGDAAYDITTRGSDLECQQGYYGGPDEVTYGDHDYNTVDICGSYQIWGGNKGKGNWRPIYCREWLELDRYDECDYIKPDPTRYFGTIEIDDNCTDVTVDSTTEEWLNECGEGWVKRTWTVSDDCGNETSCFQKVYVFCRSDFEVLFPADVEIECTDEMASTLSGLDAEAITAISGVPEVHDDECELIGISYEDQRIEKIDESCYKILRTWTIIDWCKFDPDEKHRDPDVIVDDRMMAADDAGDRNCIYRYLKDGGDGYMQYLQVIKVVDNNAPEVTCVVDTTICVFGDDECESADIELFLGDATDECTTADNMDYRWRANDNDYNGHGNTLIDNLPLGENTITLTALDGCGNFSECELVLTIENCKAPTPYCFDGIVTVVMPSSGCVTVWATDLLEKAEDNCSAPWPGTEASPTGITVSFSDDTDDQSRQYCCDTIPNGIREMFTVEIWVTDEHDNQDFCATQVIIEDSEVEGAPGACENAAGLVNVGGGIMTEFTEAVEAVDVELMSAGNIFTTGVDGKYVFDNLMSGETYAIVPKLDDNPLNGVSTLDLVILQKHILGIQSLDSPYKVIAADINNSGSVSALDIVEARKLILGIYDKFPQNTSWRFVPSDYNFSDPTRPFGFPEEIEIAVAEDVTADFVGVKVGDVNESNTPHSLMNGTVRSQGVLSLAIADRQIEVGEEVRIAVSSKDFNDIMGYQFTMEATGMELLDIQAGIIDVDASNFGVFENGLITTSWNHESGVSSSAVLFTLVYRSGVSSPLSDALKVSSKVTRAEAYTVDGSQLDIAIEFEKGHTDFEKAALFQNTPNPFDNVTRIGFSLPESGQAILTIRDVAGKTLKVIEGTFTKGYNEVLLKQSELRAAGVMYYTLKSGEFTATKKMVVIE